MKLPIPLLLLVLCIFPVSCTHQSTHKIPQSSQKQILRVNIFDDPDSLDPRAVRMAKDLTVVKQLFEGLTRIDADGIPQPAVAEHIEVSSDLLTYTFYLRETYWTNGDPVTAYDFKYAWTEALSPAFASQYAYMLYPIKNAKKARIGECPVDAVGIVARDAHTLEVQLETPTPYFLELTAFPLFFPVNQTIDSQQKEWAYPPCQYFVCNGPFRLKKWTPQSELELVKNASYWDQSSVHLQMLTFSILDNNNTESQLYEQGLLDWLGQPTSRNLHSELIANTQDIHSYAVAGTFWLRFNTNHPPFDQTKLRQAFAYAINRREIITHILQGHQAIATGPIPPSMSVQPTPYFADGDRVRALQLFEEVLCENGWSRATFPKIILNYNPSERTTKIVQLIQQQWNRSFDIEIRLEPLEHHVLRQRLAEGQFQVGTADWMADFHDPLAFLELFSQDNTISATSWRNAAFTQLLVEARYECNLEKRIELLAHAEKILVNEMPIAPIYHYAFDYLKRSSVTDVLLSPLGTADFKFATIE